MVFGMTLAFYTFLHVALSLLGLIAGFTVLISLIKDQWPQGWNRVFLAATIATDVTGYGFPFVKLLPSHIVGALSLFILALALLALYAFKLSGLWRKVYVVTAAIALYFNGFVFVIQSFLKIPFLTALAPTQKEPPFALAQGALLVLVVVLAWLAVRNFKK